MRQGNASPRTGLSLLAVVLLAGSAVGSVVALAQSLAPAAKIVPEGSMVLVWHTNIAPRWLDPQQHDGGATPDNFLNVLHDALIKNFREELYEHLALAERYEFAEDAKSAIFRLRPGLKFHNGAPVTPEDVKWSYEHYRGAWAKVLHDKTDGIEILDDHTLRFAFKGPFLDFPRLIGTANVSGAGWVVPAKYYREVGPDGFAQKPIGAGPYRLVSQEPGTRLDFEAVSLVIDREAINDAESGGYGRVRGNWINDDARYSIEWPKFPRIKAKELMKEAGYSNGFNVDWLTPAPNYYSRGERIVSQLQNIGIRSKLQVMERGVFLKRQQGGLKEWPGVQIIMNGARIGASWANWYESHFKCGGYLAADRICVHDLDAKFDQYLASDQPAERKALAEQIQRGILENYYFVPVFRHAFVNAIGPRIAATKWQDVFPTAVTTGYA
jgi:ABC-type transport system substrate-binding protein